MDRSPVIPSWKIPPAIPRPNRFMTSSKIDSQN
jgi:hypothetical protein